MWEVDKTTGNITLHQGDSGEYKITLQNLPFEASDFTLYFQAQDPDTRKDIGDQIYVSLGSGTSAVFKFTGEYTKIYTVPVDDETKEYDFTIKLCSEANQYERTLLQGTMTVKPQGAEGING